MVLGKGVFQTGKFVGAINIIILVTIQIQIHGLCLVAAGGNVEVGGIEFQMLKIFDGVARLLYVRRKGWWQRGPVVCVANGWRRWMTGWSITYLWRRTLYSSPLAALGAMTQRIGGMTSKANEFFSRG